MAGRSAGGKLERNPASQDSEAEELSTKPNRTSNRLRKLVATVIEPIVGFFVVLSLIGACLTLVMLVKAGHGAEPRIEHVIGQQASTYCGVGIVIVGLLVLLAPVRRLAIRRLMRGTGLLLVAAALLFLFSFGHAPQPELKAEAPRHHSSHHNHHAAPHKSKPKRAAPSMLRTKNPAYVASTNPTATERSASPASGASAGCGCDSPVAYYTKEESPPKPTTEEQPESQHESSDTGTTSPNAAPSTPSTPSASAATTPASTSAPTETGTTNAPTTRGTGEFNSGVEDIGTHDSGSHDSGSYDSGSYDSGSHDSGSDDTGSYDSGSDDAGEHDSGSNDSGNYESGDGE